MQSIQSLLQQDPQRLRILNLLATIELKDAYIAAGFVRNMVWDALHEISTATPLNDVDVIFFDANDKNNSLAEKALKSLRQLDSNVPWQVKNQAHMHLINNDRPYLDTFDAMSFWPEKETAIAVKVDGNNEIQVLAPFGTETLFKGLITHNPKRPKEVFLQRVYSKGWLETWPKLRMIK